MFRIGSPVYTSYHKPREERVSRVSLEDFYINREVGGRTAGCCLSLPARERLLGILAGTGLWYSNIMDGEQSNMNRQCSLPRPPTI